MHALAHRHDHRVGRHGHDDPDDQEGDQPDGHQDGLAHRDEPHLKRPLGFGQGFGERVLEGRVDRPGHRCGGMRVGDFDDEDAGLVGPALGSGLEALVEIVPMEKQLVFVHRPLAAAVNPPNRHRPVTAEDRALQGDVVADLPPEAPGKPAADHAALTVFAECVLLILWQNEFRVEVEKGLAFNGEVREKILAVDVDTAEPGHVRDRLDAVDGSDFLHVGDRQEEGERYGVADDEAIGGRRGHAGIPGIHHGAQQPEGEHGHRHPEDRQQGTQLVPERVTEQQLPHHRRERPCRGV